MTDRPILFSATMVRALLAGTKTQTRRVLPNSEGVKEVRRPNDLTWEFVYHGNPEGPHVRPPRIDAGDRLWVRETWQGLSFGDYLPTKSSQCEVRYAATDPCADLDVEARGYPWRPSIFMPRFASRLTLTVTDVRVERLQDISEADALAEGIDRIQFPERGDWGWPQRKYGELWDSINGPGAWNSNPWVAAYSFEVHHSNIDQMAKEAP